jgi:hypothetical protein
MARKLVQNVFVADPETGGGTWYGPSYPQNQLTADVAGNLGDHLFAEADEVDVHLFPAAGHGQFAGEEIRALEDAKGNQDDEDELEALTKAELQERAEANGVDVASGATKGELVEALRAAGVRS